MSTTADVVVAGAGHNGLITAAYLACSGREVIVLDAAAVPGGGATTEELLLPGYRLDRCATGHTLIRTNPLLADDELGLHAEHGLRYVDPDPVAMVAFPDGEQFRMSLDEDETVAEVARFSRRDADSYRRLLRDWSAIAPLVSASRHEPIGWGPTLDERLAGRADAGVWRRRAALSAWDVIQHEFESEHIRAFLLWQAFMTFVSLDHPGSGLLPYGIVAARQRRSWSIPVGGSGSLTAALLAVIEANGGTVLCDREVASLVIEGERCVGVETVGGERFDAREAVVSSIHVKHLIDMAPRDRWDPSFVYGVETFHTGLPMFAVHLLTDAVPTFAGQGPEATAVSSGIVGWPADVIAAIRAARDDRPRGGFPWVLMATPTLVDPDRAPAGHHTVKFLVPVSTAPPPGAASWDEAKDDHADALLAAVGVAVDGLDGDHVLGRLVQSPTDIERANKHMIGGSAHGGDRVAPFTGAQRPAPGWADHPTPIPGLYQTGGTTHPGGSITGIPGRNAAQVVLRDLGTSLAEVVAGRGSGPRRTTGANRG